MAKNINHLQHVKSSVVENGMPKLPAPSVLVEGEIAVNYAADKETISLKNSSGVVVTFSSDNYYSEKKLGSGFTGENSGVTVTQAINDTEKVIAAALNDLDDRKLDVSAYTESVGDFYTKEEIDGVLGSGFTVSSVTSSITDAFKENELVIAAALNDLDDRKLDASAYTPTDLSDYATKQWVDEERLGSGFTGENSGRTVTQVIEDDELAISAALNDLNTRKLDTSGYTPGKLDIWQVTDFDFASAGYSCDDLTPYMQGEKCLVIANMRNEEEYPSGYYVLGLADAGTYAILDLGYMSFTVFLGCDGSDIVVADHRVNEYDTAVSSVTMNGSTIGSVNKNINLGTVVSSVTVNGSAVTVTNGVAPISITATYDSNTKKIYLKNGNATMSEIDATDFIKDGMVNDVVVDEPVSGSNSGVTCLIVTFNTDAGKEDIEIPLSEMFDSELYYTKEEVNTMLGNDFIDFSGESFSSVTDIIRADETVMAAALNDLNDRKLDASAYTPSEFTDLLDEKLGYWFSGTPVSSVTDVIRENEIVVSSALNDLESRKLDASAYTPTDLSDYATEEWVDERLGSGFTESSVTEVFNETEEVIAEALADLDSRISGNTTYINQVNSKADTIARSLSGYTPSGYSYSKSEVDVKLADKLDASAYTPTDLSGYYTKQEIDEDKLGSGFTGENSGKTVTQAINETEIVVAAALNDLDERKLDASAFTESVGDFYTKEEVDNFLGDWFTSSSAVSSVTEVIEENELIIAQALNDLDERIDEISGSSSGGGNALMISIPGYFNTTTPTASTLDFSDYPYSYFVNMLQNNQDIVLIDENGQVFRYASNDDGALIFIGQRTINNNGVVLAVPFIAVMENDSPYFDYANLDSGGGSSNALTGVSVNGTAATVSNNVANITSVPAGIVTTSSTRNFVSNTEKTSWNNVTAKTDTTAFTQHTGDTTAHVTSAEKSTWNGKQDALSCGELKGSMSRNDVSGSGNITVRNTSGEFPTVISEGTYKVVTYMSSNTQSYGLNVTFGGNAYSLTTSNGVIEDEREITITSNKTWSATISGSVASGTILIVKLYLISSNVSVLGLVAVSNDYDDLYNKPTIPTSLSDINSAHTHSEYALNTAFTAHTASTTIHVTSEDKATWNGKQNALSNANVLSGISSTNVTNWNNASASAHSHSNKSVLDGITSTKVSNWDSAFTQAHTHDNKTILDNLTQAVIDNSHTHSNKTVLDGITTAKTAQWDNAISAVSFNGTDATVTNHKAAITATIPTSLSQLTSAHTHAISEVTNLQSTLNAKVSGITVNSGNKVTPTNGVANLTINASTVGALATGTTLDGIADGTTRKLSDYATTGTVNTHSGTTIPSATSSQMHLPAVTAADNGKILMVVNGQWALVNPTTIYTGTGTPQSSQGNDGDIYLQTS